MIKILLLEIEKINIEEKYKKERTPILKYKLWKTLKVINELIKKEGE